MDSRIIDNSTRQFKRVPLRFKGGIHSNLFTQKNNKTLAKTIENKRYKKLSAKVQSDFPEHLQKPLGESLGVMKSEGGNFYRKFLNSHGDHEYSTFRLENKEFQSSKGVYAYFKGEQLVYVGRCKESMKKQIDQGYGKINPKDCYLDGEVANCYLNALVTGEKKELSLWLYEMQSEEEIIQMEKSLIEKLKPIWNINKR